MWKHEVLPAHSIMMTVPQKFLDQSPKTWTQTIKNIKDHISEAQFFFFGDMIKSGLYKQKTTLPDRYNNIPFFKAPYNDTVFEYTVEASSANKEIGTQRSTKRMILVYQDKDRQVFIPLAFFNDGACQTKKPIWAVCPFCMVANTIDDEYEMGTLFDGLEDSFEGDDAEALKMTAFNEFAMSLCFMEILNCGNIITKDVTPPEKLNRKRIRNGKLPLYSYKILEVVKGKPKQKNAGSVPWGYKSPESVRFHLCRGHFKTFTEERPLFGKYSGTFWWSPQSRGDRSKGVVEKDYSVKVDGDLAI